MLRLGSEDEDDFFVEVTKQNTSLAKLFGVNETEKTNDSSDATLKYVPLKENSIKQSIAPIKPTENDWEVVKAIAVMAFKMINSENISQGKLAMVALKSSTAFKLILYRNKQQILATVNLSMESKFVYKNNYLQFHDTAENVWSVLMNETEDHKLVLDLIMKNASTLVESPDEVCQKIEEPKSKVEEIETDSLNNSNSGKTRANILSRMAKVGQALPKLANVSTTTDQSDSSVDENITRNQTKPVITQRKPQTTQIIPKSQTSNSLVSMTQKNELVDQYSLPYSQSQIFCVDNPYMNAMLSDNRVQNTEIRMNLTKMDSKIDRLLDKIDILDRKAQNPDQKHGEDEILLLEERILDLKKENRQLRLQIEANSSKSNESSEMKEQIRRLQNECDNQKDVITDLTRQLEIKSNTLSQSNGHLKEYEIQISELRQTINSDGLKLSDSISQLNCKNVELEQLKNKILDLESNNSVLSKTIESKENEFEETVKDIMNNLYNNISLKLQETNSLTSKQVSKIISTEVKSETLRALGDRKK